ncbi:hypothetical protein GALMADRAFT_66986, partial [Galerina marginata CBS 339.88]
ETGYYNILGVPITATTDDTKEAYRRLAIKHHPDKNPNDPHAEEHFKEIAIAYQTLSDDTLRRKYNEFGPEESAPEGGYVDPEEVFGASFGGERRRRAVCAYHRAYQPGTGYEDGAAGGRRRGGR